MSETSVPQNNTRNLFAVIFAIVLPTFVTLVYFKWLADYAPSVQQTAYSIGKTIQFVFPVIWVWLFFRHRFKRPGSGISTTPTSTSIPNWLWSVGFGMMVCVAMGVAFWLLSGSDEIAQMKIKLTEKVSGLGIASVWKFALLGIFYAVVHSFLEEYYWRWFVYDLLKKFVSIPIANVISSLGFMAHHVILLSVYFGWASPLTWLCSAGVAIGGAYWAWLYQRTGTLLWSWLSHAVVDAGIFVTGYFLLGSLFTA